VRDAYLQNRRALLAEKLAPEITDGTKVPAWTKEDDRRYGPGEDMFLKPTIEKYRPTIDDAVEAELPDYDDPEGNVTTSDSDLTQQASDPNLPQYDDPEAQ
jgi:phospholipid-binding lipoprotein MlaA